MDTLSKPCRYTEDVIAPFDLTQIIEGEALVTPHVRGYAQENDQGKVFNFSSGRYFRRKRKQATAWRHLCKK